MDSAESCCFLASFHYCPKCGGEFVDNNFKSKKCLACGFIYYFNPSSAVVALIKNAAGELLVGTRAFEPAKGTLDLLGGFVDPNETAEEAVCREVMEESRLEVTQTRYLFSIPNLYNYSDFEVHTLDLFFECSVDDFSPLQATDDVAKLQFMALSEIQPEQFGLASIKAGMKRYLA